MGAQLGLSAGGLREAILRSIDFFEDIRRDYADAIPNFLISDAIGPRGDAYGTGGGITEAEAEDYHAFQLEALARSAVDVIWAATHNNVPEVIGIARAAKRLDLKIAVSLSLDSKARLSSGPTLAEAVETVDQAVPGAVAWYSVNCSHPHEFEPALTPGPWTDRLRSIRPNAAAMDKMALCKLGHLEDGDPEELRPTDGRHCAAVSAARHLGRVLRDGPPAPRRDHPQREGGARGRGIDPGPADPPRP